MTPEAKNGKSINHFNEIVHVRQYAVDCWARSSQMFFSWIMSQLGFSRQEVEEVYESHLLPKRIIKDLAEVEVEELYRELNQRLLGRRLAQNEPVTNNFHSMVTKIYQEWDSAPQDPDFFASVVINYLAVLGRFLPDVQVKLWMDDPELTQLREELNVVQLLDLRDLDERVVYNNLWRNTKKEDRKRILLDLLGRSPLLARDSGHAFVISGYDSKKDQFIVNDSMTNKAGNVDATGLSRRVQNIALVAEVGKPQTKPT